MNPFDPVKMELDGYALVEASAGTGKTYGITSLYLRLIMEEGLLPGQILVVTFTRAATEELVMKIRQRLEGALNYLKTGEVPENDEFIQEIQERLPEIGMDREKLALRVHQAILRLDEAAVFTIHGFCQRMLNEFAFEAGAPLKKDVIQSEEEFHRDGCRQFLRDRLYRLEEKRLGAVAKVLGGKSKEAPLSDALYDSLKPLLTMKRPRIVPDITFAQGLEILDRRAEEMGRLKALGKEHGAEYMEIVEQEVEGLIDAFIEPIEQLPAFSKVISPDAVRKKLAKELNRLLSKYFDSLMEYDPERDYASDGRGISSLLFDHFCSSGFLLELWDAVVRSRAGGLKKLDKGVKVAVGRELARLWEDKYRCGHKISEKLLKNPLYKGITRFLDGFSTADQELLAGLLSDARRFVLEYADEQKALLSLISYDDMIQELHRALVKEPRAESLARQIRERFRVALIDEFQDTDRLQWEIFSAIYPDPAKDRLYLIGDPKQAIYGFRGADIFTYLKAKGVVPAGRRFSLGTNWRSNREVIEAVNAIFSSNEDIFILDGIKYSRVEPKRDGHEHLALVGEDESCPVGLELWGDMDKDDLPRQTAMEIARLITLGINGKARIRKDNGEPEPLGAGHIAVLVHSFYEAERVRDELMALDIPSVYYGRSSVFGSPEATELLYILNAVSSPADKQAVSTALGTVALGFQAGEILEAQRVSARWDRIVDDFVELKRIWQEQGVFPMLMALFHRFDLPKRILGLRGGERSLTNLRQLAEHLSDAEKELPGPEQLILWLKKNISGGAGEDEEHQLRLETDENVVKIMTYHRSKGLEFPVVFLPFLDQFERKKRDDVSVYYSHEDDCYVYNCLNHIDQSQETAVELAELQSEAEIMRLIYVALTRARCRLYLPVSDGRIAKLIARKEPMETDVPDGGQDLDELALAPEMEKDPISSLCELDENIGAILKGGAPKGQEPGPSRDEGAEAGKWEEEMDDEELRELILGILNGLTGTSCVLAHELEKRHKEAGLGKGRLYTLRAPELIPATVTRSPLAPWVWRQLSFSSITAFDDTGHEDAISAMLRTPSGSGQEEQPEDMFGFPKGARAGNCIHTLFENISFDADQLAIKEEAIRCLAQYEIDESWADVLTEMALRVLNAELAEGIRLSGTDPSWLSKEMGFYMPVTRFSLQTIEKLFPEMERGIMKGYIDLAFRHGDSFYILDYKSNWLGNQPEDYCQKAMEQAMDDHDYWLQAAIYLHAMERFVASSFPAGKGLKVAGVFYLFVRGVGADPGNLKNGILFVSPDQLRSRYPGLFSDNGRRVA